MRISHAAALLAATLASSQAGATPFATVTQGALTRNFALPALGDHSLTASGHAQGRATYDLTNDYLLLQQGREELLIDGEFNRWAIDYRRGFAGRWEWGVELPLWYVSDGFMDPFIRDWHRWFGLPQGGRDTAPDNLYRVRYVKEGETKFDLTETGLGLGDLLVTGGWQWREDVALRGLLKLPTGDDDLLAGGNFGAALWADAALPLPATWPLQAFASLGASANVRGAPIGAQQNTVIALGGAGFTWNVFGGFDLGAQIDAHSPTYAGTNLDAFTRPGVQLVYGGSYHRPGWRVDLAMQEDIVTRSSPDLSFHLAVTVTP